MTSYARPRRSPQGEEADGGRFPYKLDRLVMDAFLRGVVPALPAGPGVLTVARIEGAMPVLGVVMEGVASDPVTIARYADDGSIEFLMPHNVLVRAYARLAWNHMLDILGEPCDRRVRQEWSKRVPKPGEDLPVAAWHFDDKPFVPDEPRTIVGRLTLDAWRNQ